LNEVGVGLAVEFPFAVDTPPVLRFVVFSSKLELAVPFVDVATEVADVATEVVVAVFVFAVEEGDTEDDD